MITSNLFFSPFFKKRKYHKLPRSQYTTLFKYMKTKKEIEEKKIAGKNLPTQTNNKKNVEFTRI